MIFEYLVPSRWCCLGNEGALRSQTVIPFPVCPLCFLLAAQNVSFQLILRNVTPIGLDFKEKVAFVVLDSLHERLK